MSHLPDLPGTVPEGHPPVPEASPIDWGTVLEDIGGDEELLRELVEAFVATYPETLQEIRQALCHDDLRTVSRAAHKLKGAVSNFGFGPAYDAARNLEEMALAARLAATRVTVTVVEQEFAGLAEKLLAHFRAPVP
jgi:two-component system, sensor histidine kinase and response regulator